MKELSKEIQMIYDFCEKRKNNAEPIQKLLQI